VNESNALVELRILLPSRTGLLLPSAPIVETALADLEQVQHDFQAKLEAVFSNEGVPHVLSLAKKATAFFQDASFLTGNLEIALELMNPSLSFTWRGGGSRRVAFGLSAPTLQDAEGNAEVLSHAGHGLIGLLSELHSFVFELGSVGAGDAFGCCHARFLIWVFELARAVHPIGVISSIHSRPRASA
jgi:hypothetical protein